MKNERAHSTKRVVKQAGFTMMEVMVSVAILTIGLVGMLSLFSMAIASTHTSREDMIAKLEANEAMENIFTARNSAEITWTQINNVATGGIFLDGYQPIYTPGPDGLDGTADDVAGNVANASCPGPSQCYQQPGPDGILGTSDDTYLPLNNFKRQILISSWNANDTLRQVTVNVQYTTSEYRNIPKTYTVTSLISKYR